MALSIKGAYVAEASWIGSAAGTVHLVLVIVVVLRVVSRRLYPGTSLAWLLLVVTVPYVGLALYVLIGERPLGRRRVRRMLQMREPLARWLAELPSICRVDVGAMPVGQGLLARLANASTGFPPMGGAEVALIEGAPAILSAIARDIDAARQSCDMTFYIWNEGGQADQVALALERAAQRGVRCRVLLDSVGSKEFLSGQWCRRLREAGVHLEAALPVGLVRAAFVRMDLRLHRKLVIIDGRLGYTGSMNLVDPAFFKQQAGFGMWVDAMLRIEGAPVATLELVFAGDWLAETGEAPEAMIEIGECRPGGAVLQTVPSGPDLSGDNIRRLVLTAIYEARRELIVTTPYFVPDEAVLVALESAAMRGVEVTLIVPARVDSRLVRYASRSFFESLMEAGVRIREFDGGLLHTKSLTVDGELTLFGTFNLDIRSLRLNFELTMIAYDAELSQAVRALQKRYESASKSLELSAWRERSKLRRLAENTARLASPLL